jgi:hypothetical protein
VEKHYFDMQVYSMYKIKSGTGIIDHALEPLPSVASAGGTWAMTRMTRMTMVPSTPAAATAIITSVLAYGL